MIYFIQNLNTKRIKIGYSADPNWRLKNLQTGSDGELKVLFSIPGGYKEETELKHRFKHLHYRGEWYDCKGELYQYIQSIKPLDVEVLEKLFSDSGLQDTNVVSVPWELVKVSLATPERTPREHTPESEDKEKTPYILLGCLLLLIAFILSLTLSVRR